MRNYNAELMEIYDKLEVTGNSYYMRRIEFGYIRMIVHKMKLVINVDGIDYLLCDIHQNYVGTFTVVLQTDDKNRVSPNRVSYDIGEDNINWDFLSGVLDRYYLDKF